MKLERRMFLKTSLAASASAALTAPLSASSSTPRTGREFYELRSYRLQPGAGFGALDGYLERALLPALQRRGISNVGAFTELEVNKAAATSAPLDGSPLWLLIPYPTPDAFVTVSAEIHREAALQKAGAGYLDAPKAHPAFGRIDSWLLLAFTGMPRMELPEFSRRRTPGRFFEMRDYESHSELKALSKVDMFNAGEIEIMKDLGMSPIFFGQALAGPNLPHLRYMTSGPNLTSHLANWKKFGPDPRWTNLKENPIYADNTSKNTARYLAPRPYSEI